MIQVNIHETKTKLSSLLKRVAAGEEVIIAKAGKPIARLVPLAGNSGRRVMGRYQGQGYIADDFNAPMPDIEDDFYGS